MAVKSLKTLIKLQKTYVDEQRQHLARLLDNLALIQGRIAQLEIRKAREQEAANDPATRLTYGAFLRDMIRRGRELEKERITASDAVKLAQDKLAELFEDLKRYQIAEEQRLAEEAQAERHAETIDLDEVGSVMHERNKN